MSIIHLITTLSIIAISHKSTSRDTVIYDFYRTEIYLRKSEHSCRPMQDHGFVAKIDERLGNAERQQPQAGAEASHEDERLHGCSPPPDSAPDPVKIQQSTEEG
jgi:hypothetical protein